MTTSARARRRPAIWIPTLSVGVLVFLVGAARAPASADTPPPIPTAEDREEFIAHHRAATTGPEAFAPLLVHDEYDVTHYDVSLSLDIPNQIVTGEVQVDATAQVANLSEVDLDLFTCLTVDYVTAGGSPASYNHANNLLSVTLDNTYQIGESFTVGCGFNGHPCPAPGYPWSFFWNTHAGAPMVCTYSEPYGAPGWWLCKDDPKDKATFRISLTVPDSLFAVSNGYLNAEVNHGNGTKTFEWITDYPMSPYLFSIAVTNFSAWTEIYTGLDGQSTMPVHYWAYPEDLTQAQVSWSNNIQMMEFYASIFGEYPFMDEKYAIAEFDHSGAMEHQTATSMGSGWVNGTNSNDYVVAHELAHSWVGDMITMTEWSHAWTKEGFATHCEALYFEDLFGLAYYHGYMNSMNPLGYGGFQLYAIQPPLHGAIYFKGAWVLHMLRHVIGDAAFFDGVYAYTTNPAYRYGDADTEDLRMMFENASGTDLTWFFDQWVYNPGYPHYSARWMPVPAGGGYDVVLDIEQTQTTGPIFKMPIDVRINTDMGPANFVVWDSLQTQSFTLHVDDRPTALFLDVDYWIIRQIQTTVDVAGGGAGPVAVLSLAQNEPNPFNPVTTIRFSVAERGPATLRIYDAAGRVVARLYDAVAEPGPRAVIWDGRAAASGVYYYRLETPRGDLTRAMTLVK